MTAEKSNKSVGRSGIIELMRFFAAVIVVVLHSHGLYPETGNYPFAGGYIAVEFFLILTGYFTARQVYSDDGCAKS